MQRKRAGAGTLVMLSAVLSAASCTAILGISGDFKQGAGGGSAGASSASHGGGMSGSLSTSSQGAGATTGSASANGGAGGAAGTGAGGTGGNDAACLSCIAQQCANELGVCNDDMTSGCGDWYSCLATCHNSADATACDLAHKPAKSEYSAIYNCAAANCAMPCEDLDPGKHPCQQEAIYDNGSELYCAFGTDAGKCLGAHCCEHADFSPASCLGTSQPCPPGDYDWYCEGPGNCTTGTSLTCCTTGPGHVTFADSSQCETTLTNEISGALCQASCNAAQGQYQVCTANTDCTPPQTCWAVAAHANHIGVCR